MNSRATSLTRLVHIVAAAVVLCIGHSAVAQSTSFVLQNPSPSARWLNDIQYAGGSLYAVGEQNTIVKSVDGGQTWMRQTTDANALTTFRDAYFVNANRGWAAGGWNRERGTEIYKYGVVEWTNDGGATWARETVTQSTMINGVYFSTPTQGWAVGCGREALQDFTQLKPFAYFTNDNGQTWTRQTNGLPGGPGELKSVVFADNSTGYVIGGAFSAAPFVLHPQVKVGTYVMWTTNSGNTWSPTTTFPSNVQVTQIATLSQTRAYACGSVNGNAALIYTSDNGMNWNQQVTGFPSTPVAGRFNSIVFSSANVGYAVGFKNVSGQANVLVMKTVNGGNSWFEVDPHVPLTPTNGTVERATVADDNRIWLCGAGTASWVAYSANGGGTWTMQSSNAASTQAYASPVLNSVSFADKANGWSVGVATEVSTSKSVCSIAHTADSGMSWAWQGSALYGSLSGVSAISAMEAWAAGYDNSTSTSILLHTIDGGATWTRMTVAVGTINDIAFSRPANGKGVIASSTGIWYTTDGGTTWLLGSAEVALQIRSFYGSNVWGLRDNALLNSTNSGQTWTVTANNAAAFSTANTLHFNGVSFIPSGVYGTAGGWMTVPAGGVPQPFTARTTNSGATWTVQTLAALIQNPIWPCGSPSPCPQYMVDNSYTFNSVKSLVMVAPNMTVGVTTLDYNALNSTGNVWTYPNGGYGARVVATTDAGASWFEIDSSLQGTDYMRLAATLTDRVDVYGVGVDGMIRHGFVAVPLVASSPDTLFNHRILSQNPTDSAIEKITVTNPGTSQLNLGAFSITSGDPSRPELDYTVLRMPTAILPGQSDTIIVQFKPSYRTQRFATLTFSTSSIARPSVSVALRGSGNIALITATPMTLFRNIVAIDGASELGTVLIHNPGTPNVHADLHFGTPILIDSTYTNSYSIVYSPTNAIPPGGWDSIVVKFQPSVGGPKRGAVILPTNTLDYPMLTITLGGVGGVRTIAQDTSSISFTDTVNCSSSSKCFVVRNTGSLPIRVDSIQLAGAGKSEFSFVNTVGASIAPGQVDTICVTHTPLRYGMQQATIVIFSNAINAPQDSLKVTGLAQQALLTFSLKTVVATIPCNQTYDTTIFVVDTGNISYSLKPEPFSDVLHWDLVLPVVITDTNGHVIVRHKATSVKETDTLHFVLTWGNKSKCGPTHSDTVTFIYTTDCQDTSTSVRESPIARRFDIFQNYPNPFNPTTNITYSVAARSHVTLRVFNALGQMVRELENQVQDIGTYTSTFDAFDLPSGNYYYELSAGAFSKRMMMTLTK